ncbi:hypothetical protein GCM10029978_090580 [Actinoallomurus acanthiterrae]
MHMEDTVQGAARQLQQLTADYAGWRFGLGGSGHWWAVRRNDCLRARSKEELEVKLRQHADARPDV